MSTDLAYRQPLLKYSAFNYNTDSINECSVFTKFWTRFVPHPQSWTTSLLGWFLRLGASTFYKPSTYLFNLSLPNSVVPIQWKLAWIRPVPKVSAPAQHSDYRPIDHCSFDSYPREISGQAVHLFGHCQTSYSIIHLRPVCVRADRLNHCSHHHYSSHSDSIPCIQPTCHSYSHRSLKGF